MYFQKSLRRNKIKARISALAISRLLTRCTISSRSSGESADRGERTEALVGADSDRDSARASLWMPDTLDRKSAFTSEPSALAKSPKAGLSAVGGFRGRKSRCAHAFLPLRNPVSRLFCTRSILHICTTNYALCMVCDLAIRER